MMRDYQAIASQFVRALRGRRSQAHLSRRLGYRSNVVFDWEAGRRFPTAATALRLARAVGVDVGASLDVFARPSARWSAEVDPCSPEGVTRLLGDVRGNASVRALCTATGISRFALGRWLHGQAEPRLPDFLRVVDAGTLRLLDFLAAFVDVERLPSLQDEWRQLSLARQLAYDEPWSHAVLRALELSDIRALPRYRAGVIATRARDRN